MTVVTGIGKNEKRQSNPSRAEPNAAAELPNPQIMLIKIGNKVCVGVKVNRNADYDIQCEVV